VDFGEAVGCGRQLEIVAAVGARLDYCLMMADKTDFGLRRSMTAEARLAAIVDSSFDAIVGKDINSIITDWNPAAERMFGYTADEAVGRSILMLIPETLHGEEIEIISKIKNGERVESFDTTRRRKDGSLISVSLTISPIKDENGTIVGASKIARDITAKRENERRIRYLLREVNHRVKNQFAVILSMIRETANRTQTNEEFMRHIRERITALSRSHDLLVSSEWSGASLFELVQEHLKPFGHEERIALSGPLVTLQPNAVQYLGMAFHELGTNSAKYGALSNSAGHIDVRWSISGEEIHIEWKELSGERGGTDVDPTRRGFGNVVLQRIAPQSVGGRATLDRASDGVTWSLKAPTRYVVAQHLEAQDEPPAYSI
jgi:PAS domain S-box-containing protein